MKSWEYFRKCFTILLFKTLFHEEQFFLFLKIILPQKLYWRNDIR